MKKFARVLLIIISTFSIQYLNASSDEEVEQNLSLTQTSPRKNIKVVKSDNDVITSLPFAAQARIFLFYSVDDLGRLTKVSSHWQTMLNNPELWRMTGLLKYGEYLTDEDLQEKPKQKIIQHYLCVLANTKEDLNSLESLVTKYSLGSYRASWTKNINPQFLLNLLIGSYGDIKYQGVYDTLLSQGSILGIKLKIGIDLSKTKYSSQNIVPSYGRAIMIRGVLEEARPGGKLFRELNEKLVELEDEAAIRRKIQGLAYGECVVSQYGTVERYNSFGYLRNLQSAREFIEELITRHNPVGVEKKIEGLTLGKYGYDKNNKAAVEFNEYCVTKKVGYAIERRIAGLTRGVYGYTRDSIAAKETIECFAREIDLITAQKKLEKLLKGTYYYDKTPGEIKTLIEEMVISGSPYARCLGHFLKSFALKHGIAKLGYDKDYKKAAKYIKQFSVPFNLMS